MGDELGAGSCGTADAWLRTLSLRDGRSRGRDRRTLRAAAVDRSAGHQRLDLVAAQSLVLEQRLGERLELLAVLLQHRLGAGIAVFDDASDFLVDQLRGLV